MFAIGHRFLESLRWHNGRVWASDFFTKQVLTLDRDGSAQVIVEIPGAPSGLGFLGDGSTLVVSQVDATVQRIEDDSTVSICADFGSIANDIGNDMIVSPTGHTYAGNLGFNVGAEEPKPTNLAHIDPAGKADRFDGELTVPNGMAITPDNVGGRDFHQSLRHRIRRPPVQASGVDEAR